MKFLNVIQKILKLELIKKDLKRKFISKVLDDKIYIQCLKILRSLFLHDDILNVRIYILIKFFI